MTIGIYKLWVENTINKVALRLSELERIYAEADRLGCRLPSGDDPDGYGITLGLRNQEG